MSISNEALRKVLLEIEQKSIQSSQQITVVKQQIAAKTREGRILQLSASEIAALPPDTRVFEGVGKMFVQAPAGEITERIAADGTRLKAETAALDKKLHYLETTYKNSRANFEQILRSAGG